MIGSDEVKKSLTDKTTGSFTRVLTSSDNNERPEPFFARIIFHYLDHLDIVLAYCLTHWVPLNDNFFVVLLLQGLQVLLQVLHSVGIRMGHSEGIVLERGH